uniref:Bifunctional inhibitor/plant lipid transfer protein/seed storage helical domain-containing protein n=1 Tax=Opuntia streptacantha TaxID=393608 RepID=A0A7C9AK13_OPUST
MTSFTICFAASICSLVPSICTVLSLDMSPGGGCNGITCTLAPVLACMFLMVSPPFPITNPTLLFGTLITNCSEPATPVNFLETAPEPPTVASERTSLMSCSAFAI